MSQPASSSAPRRQRWLYLPASPLRRVVFVGAYLAFCVAMLVAGLAVYWGVRTGRPPYEPASVWDHFYPELRDTRLDALTLAEDDGHFDLLLLGGSVLEPTWGDVEQILRARLDGLCGRAYRLHNLARSAQTSRDSLIKYRHLEGKRFDLVYVYDGINDVRMNNVPAEHFRDDYSHCAWYRSFEKCLAAGRISLRTAVGQQLATLGETIGRGAPETDANAAAGADVKTPGPFARNLEEILDRARERGDRVLLSTYAWYLPADYTREKFDARSLDYSYRDDGRSCGAEMWALPEFIGPVLDAQNEAVRQLAARHPQALFVDQQALLALRGENFVDPCHLTRAGSERFVENLWPQVVQAFAAWSEQAAMLRER